MNSTGRLGTAATRFAVTGAAGFIGSHLTSALLDAGASVTAIDNLTYGDWANVTAKSERLKLVTGDLVSLSTEDMRRHLEGHDVLLHFAAEKHNNAAGTPQRVIDVNVSATARLFDAAGLAKVKKVVFASSLYAYGRLVGEAMRETDVPAPATIYGISKLAGEGLLREASQRHGYNFAIERLFFVYGPRQFAGMGYPSVIVRNFSRILKNEPPVILGDGLQVLDYVNVRDVVRATLLEAASSQEGDIVNVGSGTGTTIKELTELMLEVSGSKLKPDYGPADWTAGTRRVSDPAKIKSRLDWTAQIGLKDGLTEVWDWIKRANG